MVGQLEFAISKYGTQLFPEYPIIPGTGVLKNTARHRGTPVLGLIGSFEMWVPHSDVEKLIMTSQLLTPDITTILAAADDISSTMSLLIGTARKAAPQSILLQLQWFCSYRLPKRSVFLSKR